MGWHLKTPHPVLQKYYTEMMATEGDAEQRLVLFPLCGASVDLAHLACRGHHVVGVEGVPTALDKLLADYGDEIPSGGGLKPGAMRVRVATPGPSQYGAAAALSSSKRKYEPAPFLFGVQGDFLEFDAARAAKYGFDGFDACFDRGALVAIDQADRPAYVSNLASLIKPGGRLLLVTVEHDMPRGPPHNVPQAEAVKLLGADFEVKLLGVEDKFEAEPTWKERGASRFREAAYLCTRRQEGK